MTDEAKEARRKYLREWRKNNPDKVKQYHENYWGKRRSQMSISPNEHEQKVHEDAVFTLTDKGREYAERIINGQD